MYSTSSIQHKNKNRWFFFFVPIHFCVLEVFRWKSLAFSCPLLIPKTKGILNHRQPVFHYHYFPSFYRPPEIKTSSKRRRARENTTRSRELVSLNALFFGFGISRRHKLIRSWLHGMNSFYSPAFLVASRPVLLS